MSTLPELSWQERALAAEKTVEVLADKVTRLLNGGTHIVQRQLTRAQARAAQNRHRQEVIQTRAKALQEHSERLESEVHQRTAELRAIQDNVTFGFLLVDADFRVLPDFTKSCLGLLGPRIYEGRSIAQMLDLSPRQSDQYLTGLSQLFEDMLPEEVLVDQVITRFELDERVLQIDPRIVRAPDGTPEKILLSISDITSLEEAQREAKQNAMLIAILKSKASFARFLMDTRSSLLEGMQQLDDTARLRRVLHTIKGNSATYHLDDIVRHIHNIETRASISYQDLQSVYRHFENFLSQHQAILELDFEQRPGANVELCRSSLQELRDISRASNNPALLAWTAKASLRPASAILGPVEVFVRKLAQRLDKPLHFEVQGLTTLVDLEKMGPVLRSVTHLLRNAIDHGLEDRALRHDKPELGRVMLKVEASETEWLVLVSDDGQGIDVDAVVERAVSLGKVSTQKAKALTQNEKLDLMYLDGVSSCNQITEISGRGVGTSAVLTETRRVGGRVEVQTTKGQGTQFRIYVPKPPELCAAMKRAA